MSGSVRVGGSGMVLQRPICMIWWKKNPNVSTLTLGAVKYLISALVGILLKLALFLKTALKNLLVPFLGAEWKTALPSFLGTELFHSLPKQFIFKSRTAWNK